jgi:valyl-tRNA synthetase
MTDPEMVFGITGIAVHPDDDRYRDVVGLTVKIPLSDMTAPIVADTGRSMQHNDGTVAVIPAHESYIGCSRGERLGLQLDRVVCRYDIHDGGVLIAPSPVKYQGMHLYAARKAVVNDLNAGGHLLAVYASSIR